VRQNGRAVASRAAGAESKIKWRLSSSKTLGSKQPTVAPRKLPTGVQEGSDPSYVAKRRVYRAVCGPVSSLMQWGPWAGGKRSVLTPTASTRAETVVKSTTSIHSLTGASKAHVYSTDKEST